MRTTRALMAGMLAAATMLTACGPAMRPVTFQATPSEWRRLAGEWRGDYWMRDHDRHGRIAFTLVADKETASGDVLMISDRVGWPYQKNPPTRQEYREPLDRTQILTILFVRADDGQIDGRMDPYWDPDRRCTAVASFRGSLDGDAIGGTVSSWCVNDPAHRGLNGRWKIVRQRPRPPRPLKPSRPPPPD